MLGEQLLKNERVALVELIKNSYDADASRVDVMFEGFEANMTLARGSKIIVRDDGFGMTSESVKQAWMNPATPTKFLKKKKGQQLTPGRGRVVQGEKGIGRFAVLKLARKILLTTRARGADLETVVWFDFARFDDDFLEESGEEREIFLDQVKIDWDERKPKLFVGEEHGTAIEMKDLKGTWNTHAIRLLCRDVANLTDPVSRLTRSRAEDNFEIRVVCDGNEWAVADAEEETLKALIEDKAVFAIRGRFVGEGCAFQFNKGDGDEEISLYDDRVKGLWIWRQRYPTKLERQRASEQQEYTCGDFSFRFHIFDFARGIEGKYLLTQAEKNRLKNHRVYLYRDGVRVYPYGDPEDDWLNIDTSRGTGRAGHFFSNDQIIGWVDITHVGNPELRDKTDREGLIETGGAFEEFVFLIGAFLSFIKQHPFHQYQARQLQKSTAKSALGGVVGKQLAELKTSLTSSGHTQYATEVSNIESAYERERSVLTQRAEMTEDLAGVGLSVEMASHDIMLLMGRARDIAFRIARHSHEESIGEIVDQADMLVGVMQQIMEGMRDVQSLFRSSRRRRRVLKVEPVLDKIQGIYSGLLEKHYISYNKSVKGSSPLVATTNDGVIMQVLINLFDNAAYWLETTAPSFKREILVTLDSDAGELVFADSGPGVDSEDAPYIFEPFFSGKGQEGRGLGLYIARQLLERHGYTINLADPGSHALGGASFIVRLAEEEG